MPVLVVVAPGQGAQTPGFLSPWLQAPGVRERLEWLSAVSGVDLIAHGTTSDADTIRDTAIAQPLTQRATTLQQPLPRPCPALLLPQALSLQAQYTTPGIVTTLTPG